MNLLSVLPLALVMIAGPQLVSAVFLASSRSPRRCSLAYLAGAALALVGALTLWYLLFRLLRIGAGGFGDAGARRVVDWVVLGVLLVLMVLVFVRRGDSHPPGWMRRLEEATPRFAFGLGLLLFLAMPSDEATMAAVAGGLGGHGRPWWHLLPFATMTVLLLALPLLALLVLGERALRVLPKIRDWANAHSWVINEGVILIFVVIVGSSLLR